MWPVRRTQSGSAPNPGATDDIAMRAFEGFIRVIELSSRLSLRGEKADHLARSGFENRPRPGSNLTITFHRGSYSVVSDRTARPPPAPPWGEERSLSLSSTVVKSFPRKLLSRSRLRTHVRPPHPAPKNTQNRKPGVTPPQTIHRRGSGQKPRPRKAGPGAPAGVCVCAYTRRGPRPKPRAFPLDLVQDPVHFDLKIKRGETVKVLVPFADGEDHVPPEQLKCDVHHIPLVGGVERFCCHGPPAADSPSGSGSPRGVEGQSPYSSRASSPRMMVQ